MKRRFRIFPVFRQDGVLMWGLQWDYGRDKKRKSFVGMGTSPGRLMNQALRISRNHERKRDDAKARDSMRRAIRNAEHEPPRDKVRPFYPEH